MRETRAGGARWILAATLAALAWPAVVAAQSAADLSTRIAIDGLLADFTPAEAVFAPGEERGDDSNAGATRDVRQIHATWDARFLYLGVDASADAAGLVLLVDVRPGGLDDFVSLESWRRGVRCGDVVRPEFVVAVTDAARTVEVWRAVGTAAVERVEGAPLRAAVDFTGPGRGLEIALPWTLLFPDAATAVNPEPGAPAGLMFVLPQESSRAGLRLAVFTTDVQPGFGAFDVAPDPRGEVPLDPRNPVDIDRAARIAWDENAAPGAPAFVDFGAAVQTQAAPRFVPEPPAAGVALSVRTLQTFDGDRPSALLLGDAGRSLAFRFAVGTPEPAEIAVTARILSLRGERVRELYRDARRTPPFGDPAADRWDGRDAQGRTVPGGVYILQLRAAVSPGGTESVLQHAITVVR